MARLKRLEIASGTPRKFFHGIYLVYSMHILFPWICQRYTWYIPTICFPDKILFSSIWMHLMLWWVFAMHRTILSWDGEALLGSYVRAKITIGYDRDIPCLYMVYAINTQQWIYSAKIVMNLQSCVRTCMYTSLPGQGTSYHPSKCIFTQHEYLTGICKAYTRHILIISHLQP